MPSQNMVQELRDMCLVCVYIGMGLESGRKAQRIRLSKDTMLRKHIQIQKVN